MKKVRIFMMLWRGMLTHWALGFGRCQKARLWEVESQIYSSRREKRKEKRLSKNVLKINCQTNHIDCKLQINQSVLLKHVQY